MSSFIRQLNKYDFHKVKPSSDTESSNPGSNVSFPRICFVSHSPARPWH